MQKPITTAQLINGGNVIKQGHEFTLGFNLFDVNGDLVNLTGSTVTYKIAGVKSGIVKEGTANIEGAGHVEITVADDIGNGEMRLEFTATNSSGVQKYPANNWIRLHITPSLDDLAFTKVSTITVEQFQKQFDAMDAKANDALEQSAKAVTTSDNVKTEFDQVVNRATDSDAMSAQAAVDAKGVNKINLKTRLDDDYNEVTAKLAHNATHRTEWINVKQPPYNAPTNGIDDDSIAIQKAIDDISEGGTIYIPKTVNPYLVENSIIKDNKSFTIIIEGTVKDGITTASDFTETSLYNKGVFSFGHGAITITGNKQNNFDGNKGIASNKQFIYLFECDGVHIENIHSYNTTLKAVMGVGCKNVVHQNSKHENGEGILWSRGENIKLDKVETIDSIYNGINVLDRGIFSDAVYPLVRPKNVSIKDCSAVGTKSTDNYAVGITIDSVDHFTIEGCFVDGKSTGTMAFSFADSVGGQVIGNRAINLNNNTNGTYTYCGLGMEFDRCGEIEAHSNTFNNVLMAYKVSSCYDSSFDGELTSSLSVSSGAGNSTLYQLDNSVGANKNIRLSGISNGVPFYKSSGDVDGLIVQKGIARNPNGRVFNGYGGTIKNASFDNLLVVFDGTSIVDVFNFSNGVAKDLRLSNVKAKAATIGTGSRFFFGNGSDMKLEMNNVNVEGFETFLSSGVMVNHTLKATNITLENITNDFQYNFTNKLIENVSKDGKFYKNSGSATILATQGAVVVTHNLATTPNRIQVTPTGNIGVLTVPTSNVFSNTFQINCSSPPTGDTVIYWEAQKSF
jgi:hypothetical protein